MKVNDILLTERVHIKFDSKLDPSKEVSVYKNPGYREYIAIKKSSTYSELRGLLIGAAIYVWDANLAMHDQVSELFDVVDINASFIIGQNDDYMDAGYLPNDISDHPMLKRMLTPPKTI